MTLKKTLLCTTLTSILATTSAMAYQQDKIYHFTVLHTNDLHGRFWQNDRGEYGLPAQKTLIDQIKKDVETKGGTVLLLNAGDVNTGVPESDLQNARPDIEGMNAIGYEAMTLGNHEFDYPLQLLDMQEKWAKFPFLSANVINKKTGKTLVKPYTILNKQGLKIAVVGLTTEDTARIGNPEYVKSILFNDPITTAKTTIEQINQTEKPDFRIALTHMGYYPNAEYGTNAPGDVTLARTLDKGAFDLIIGGHTHDTVCVDEQGKFRLDYTPGESCKPDYQNGTWIVQAGAWGKYVGRADFEFKNGKAKLVNYQLIPINLKQKIKHTDGSSEYKLYQSEIPADPQLKAQLQKYQDEGSKLLNIKVGQVNGLLQGDSKIVRSQQTNLGRLIAYTQMVRLQADLAIMNSGGVRDSIQNGDVTYRDLLKVQPFGNTLSFVELTGKELIDYLTNIAMKTPGSGGFPQFYNVSMVVDRAANKIENVKIKGEPINLTKKYRVSVPSYCAAGGDGYPVVKNHPSYIDPGYVDAEMLKEFFSKNSPIDASQFEPNGEIIYK